MRRRAGWGLLVLGMFAALTAAALPNALVETVQAPAWVERGERRLALAPGMQLENRDRLLTGSGARLVVLLADGSRVQLGENVKAAVNAMKQAKNGIFTAALDVGQGAFRLTTHEIGRLNNQRAINVRAGSVTSSLRDADIWGRTGAGKDFVCLFAGRVIASHLQGGAIELTEPRHCFGAEKDQAPGAIVAVESAKMALLALETEPQYGVATQRTGGRWALDFGRFDQDGALTLHDQLAAAGYAGRIRPVRVAGAYLYELRLEQLLTEREAQSLADKLARTFNKLGNNPAPAIDRH